MTSPYDDGWPGGDLAIDERGDLVSTVWATPAWVAGLVNSGFIDSAMRDGVIAHQRQERVIELERARTDLVAFAAQLLRLQGGTVVQFATADRQLAPGDRAAIDPNATDAEAVVGWEPSMPASASIGVVVKTIDDINRKICDVLMMPSHMMTALSAAGGSYGLAEGLAKREYDTLRERARQRMLDNERAFAAAALAVMNPPYADPPNAWTPRTLALLVERKLRLFEDGTVGKKCRQKWSRAMSGDVDQLIRDLGGSRTISGVLRVGQKHEFAPDGCSRHGALFVKIDDRVYCFSLGYNDPLFVTKQRQAWLAQETGRRLSVDGIVGQQTREALLDVEMSWKDVPMLYPEDPFLVVDIAEGDDAELVDQLTEVFPLIMVEIRGRCTCYPRHDDCVDELYAVNEATGDVVLDVGVSGRSKTLLDDGDGTISYVNDWDPNGWTPLWLRAVDSPPAERHVVCQCRYDGWILASEGSWRCPSCGYPNVAIATERWDPDDPQVVALATSLLAVQRATGATMPEVIADARKMAGEDQVVHKKIDAAVERFTGMPQPVR